MSPFSENWEQGLELLISKLLKQNLILVCLLRAGRVRSNPYSQVTQRHNHSAFLVLASLTTK